jgi:hypothetical protein
MTAEISSPRPLPPPAQVVRPNAAAEQALKLLQPLDSLLAVGESAKAEVVALKELVQSFQLVLRLTLANGQQSTVQASSNQPLAQGTALTVTALSATHLGIALLAPQKPLQSLDLEQLPLGTLLQAKVISSEPLLPNKAQQNLFKLVVSLLNGSLAGTKLSLETSLALPVGSLLSAQVKGSQALSFLPLSSRLDQLALGQQLQTQQARQGSLEGLVKALQSLTSSDTPDEAALPTALRTSIDKLLGALPDLQQMRSAKGVAQALNDSGVFLEAKLLDGKQAALPQDLKANLLRLVAQLLPPVPGMSNASSSALLASTNQGSLALALPLFVRNLLGTLGQTGARQQTGSFPLPTRTLQNLEGEDDLGSLLRLAAAALSRLQTHQLSSLAQTQVGPEGNLLSTWQLEIPMRNQQELIPLQAKIQREDRPKKSAKEAGETLWRVELAFDLAPLGPLQVQAQLAHGCVSSQLWAERPSTATLIEHELGHLRERLTNAGLTVAELACKQGTPPQGQRTSLEQRWVDETA